MADGLHLTSSSRILITNDDGIDARGITALETVARALSDDVWVVAPRREQSGMSHALTLRHPIRFEPVGERRYVVDGTPSDGIFIAMRHLFATHKPDLVLSGFNEGVNVGNDVIYSATVAAAREAAFMGIPALALSQEMGDNHAYDFSLASTALPVLLHQLEGYDFAHHMVLNVNFPQPSAKEARMELCPHGLDVRVADMEQRHDPRGVPYFWIGIAHHLKHSDESSDIAALARGNIAISPLASHLNQAHTLKALADFMPSSLV